MGHSDGLWGELRGQGKGRKTHAPTPTTRESPLFSLQGPHHPSAREPIRARSFRAPRFPPARASAGGEGFSRSCRWSRALVDLYVGQAGLAGFDTPELDLAHQGSGLGSGRSAFHAALRVALIFDCPKHRFTCAAPSFAQLMFPAGVWSGMWKVQIEIPNTLTVTVIWFFAGHLIWTGPRFWVAWSVNKYSHPFIDTSALSLITSLSSNPK